MYRLATKRTENKKAVLSQRWLRDAPYRIYGSPENFGSPWLRPRLVFPKLLMGFVVIDHMKVRTKFEVRSFTHSWDNRRSYFEQPLDTPTLPFLQNF